MDSQAVQEEIGRFEMTTVVEATVDDDDDDGVDDDSSYSKGDSAEFDVEKEDDAEESQEEDEVEITPELVRDALICINNNPIKEMKQEVASCVRKQKRKGRFYGMDREEKMELIMQFVTTLKELPFCFNKNIAKFSKCQCLRKLPSIDNAVRFLFRIGCLTRGEQDCQFKSMMCQRKRGKNGWRYMTMMGVKENNFKYPVCTEAFRNLFGLFRRRWEMLFVNRHIPGPLIPPNIGNQYGALDSETKKAVIDFLNEYGERHGESYATRMVREETGYSLRDEEKGKVDLPSSHSKRRIYERFCYDRGHDMRSTNKGGYTKRKVDGVFWFDDLEVRNIPSWRTFWVLWKTHCNHIRIRKPCLDTCGECTTFANKFRYRAEQQKKQKEKEGNKVEGEEDEGDDNSFEDDDDDRQTIK